MSNDNGTGAGLGASVSGGAPNIVGGGSGVAPHLNGTGARNPRDMKARMFSAQNKMRKSEKVVFFGEEIEIKQSSLGQVVEMANMRDEDDDQGVAIYVLLNYAYVPGTEDRVFETADVEQLKSMPFGDDFNRVIDSWRRITGIKIEAATKN